MEIIDVKQWSLTSGPPQTITAACSRLRYRLDTDVCVRGLT